MLNKFLGLLVISKDSMEHSGNSQCGLYQTKTIRPSSCEAKSQLKTKVGEETLAEDEGA